MRLPLLFAGLAFALPSLCQASKLVVEASAIEKALNKQVFKNNGKYFLGKRDDCNYPYLETPAVTLRGGRIYVRTHLAGRIGTKSALGCLGTTDSTWLTLSGKPYYRDGILGLSDIKVEEAEKQYLARLVEALLVSGTAKGLKVNLQEAVQSMVEPAKTSPYVVSLSALDVSRISAESNKLVLDVDLTMTAK